VLGEFSDKVRVIPFIVDVEAMRRRSDDPVALGVREWARGSPVALSVGRLVYYKGVDVLLDALSLTKDLRLVIVGDGPLRQQLQLRALALGIDARIKWLGAISDRELVGAFSGADFFVLPSVERAEAFGLVQVEAMAAGLPVISTLLGTSVEFVNVDGRTGSVVPPRDATVLAEAMQLLSDDESRRRRLASGALQRAEDFREETLVERYRALYAAARDESG
jgi:rhamnosyl/mannosyltransferase